MVDRLIISADEQSYFKQYLKIVVKAWKKFFPELKISLAFVAESNISPNIFEGISPDLEVKVFPLIDGIPTANQAKMARHFLACQYADELVTIEDIDTIPLQSQFFKNKFESRKKQTILFVGKEVYEHTSDRGKCPISTMTGESYLMKTLVNPENLTYEQFIISFIGIEKFDKKEDISKQNFSDESLIRFLLDKNVVATTKVNRSVDIGSDWIDRSWWNINAEKLSNHGYITCNFLRPFSTNYGNMQLVVDFIYNSKNKPKKEVIFTINGEQ